MGDLVAQVAEQRPVGLTELTADLLPVGMVGLREVERHHAVGVAGEDGLVPAREQVEGQAPGREGALRGDGEIQLEELEDQPALGCLGLQERHQTLDVVVIGPGAGEPARDAQRAGVILPEEPVAAGDLVVGAAGPGLGPPVEGDDLAGARLEAEQGSAAQALVVLEEHQLAAHRALEGSHVTPCSGEGRPAPGVNLGSPGRAVPSVPSDTRRPAAVRAGSPGGGRGYGPAMAQPESDPNPPNPPTEPIPPDPQPMPGDPPGTVPPAPQPDPDPTPPWTEEPKA